MICNFKKIKSQVIRRVIEVLGLIIYHPFFCAIIFKLILERPHLLSLNPLLHFHITRRGAVAHLQLGVFHAGLFLVSVVGGYESVQRLDVFLHGVCLHCFLLQEHLLDQVREVCLSKFLLKLELL